MAGLTVEEQILTTRLMKERQDLLQRCLEELNMKIPSLIENVQKHELESN